MNYDHLNITADYWLNELRPHTRCLLQVNSFDEYLKQMSFLPSGKWLRDREDVKLSRPPIALDPVKFVTNYKNKCVTILPPLRPEDGLLRIIYQFSPEFHAETALITWVEHNVLQSYFAIVCCYKNEKEFQSIMGELKDIRRTGNTEDRGVGFHQNNAGGDSLFRHVT